MYLAGILDARQDPGAAQTLGREPQLLNGPHSRKRPTSEAGQFPKEATPPVLAFEWGCPRKVSGEKTTQLPELREGMGVPGLDGASLGFSPARFRGLAGARGRKGAVFHLPGPSWSPRRPVRAGAGGPAAT